ncbi:hypothetical protein P8452_11263 [Trifolium repens]|nr:hypothetical protein P8452_11263 [Trifolium repens]
MNSHMKKTPNCTIIKDITTKSDNISCLVRVVRKWLAVNPKDPKVVFSMDCVLLDSQGNKIQSTMRHQLIYLFDNELEEGTVYKLIGLRVTPNNKDDLLKVTPRGNIQTLLESQQESVFIILAKIKSIDDRVWWYQSCPEHNIKVSPDEDEYYCNRCKRHISKVVPRFFLKLHVEDETKSTTFVMFDKDAFTLLNKTCAELVKSVKKGPDPQVLPKEITNLESRTYLFKIASDLAIGTNFEPSYKVKTVTDDHNLIEQWKELGKSKVMKCDQAKIARARRKFLISQKRMRTGVIINGNTNLPMLSIIVNPETIIKRDQAKIARARRKYLITRKRTTTNVIINDVNTQILDQQQPLSDKLSNYASSRALRKSILNNKNRVKERIFPDENRPNSCITIEAEGGNTLPSKRSVPRSKRASSMFTPMQCSHQEPGETSTTSQSLTVNDIDTPMSEAFHQSVAHVGQNNDVTDGHINTNDEFHASTSGLPTKERTVHSQSELYANAEIQCMVKYLTNY